MPSTVLTTLPEPGIVQAEWPSIVNADTNGDPASLSRWVSKSVQVSGTWGSSGEITLEGSNDGVTYLPLNNSLGIPLVFTANGITDILENTRHIRPSKTTSDAALNVKVVIIGV